MRMRMKPGGVRMALMAAALPLLLAACRRSPTFNGQVVDPAQPAPDLAGVNWDGKPFRLRDQRGKVAVVFFGYTYCPDVCPFTLAKMKLLYGRLGARADDVKVVFVSVDPQRDSVEKLAQYVPNFDRRFYGVRMEDNVLLKTAGAFNVAIHYGAPKGGLETPTFYLVDHTATYFVIDRQGRLRLKFPPNATVDQMLPDVEKLLAT
jgi:protein SCO1/2